MAVLEGQQQGDPQQEHPRAGPGRQGGPEGGQGRAQLLQVSSTAVGSEFRESSQLWGVSSELSRVAWGAQGVLWEESCCFMHKTPSESEGEVSLK